MTKETDINAEHKARMQEQQQEVRKAIRAATDKRGIIVYLYGEGKGKSSSALGTLLRALGHGQRAGVLQFIKGKWKTGEQKFLQESPQVDYHVMGSGFTWDTQDREQDIAAAQKAWETAERLLSDEQYNIVLLDEITYMYDFDYLPLADVLEALKKRPQYQNVFITGRTAIPELVELADTVSEVRDIKHAFRAGVKAQKGIEW